MSVINDDKKKRYLVRYNKDPFCLFDTERKAIDAINSIANEEERSLRSPKMEIFRRTVQDGKEIRILVKRLGYIYDSSLNTEICLDVVPLNWMHLESAYADKIAQYKAEKVRNI